MKCEKCNLKVNGTVKCCPLCQSSLSGEKEPSLQVFPIVPLKKQRLFLSIMGFISIVVCSVCVIINLSVHSNYWWSLFLVGGIVSFWISFSLAVQKRKNLPKTILWQVFLISLICIAWDIFTGFHRWSLNFVTPILCSSAIVAMAVIGRITKTKINDYMVYMLIDIFLCLSALFLLIFKVVTVELPSLICVGTSIISLGGLLFFQGKALLSELHRRMHI